MLALKKHCRKGDFKNIIVIIVVEAYPFIVLINWNYKFRGEMSEAL